MTPTDAAADFHNAAAFYNCRIVSAEHVVKAACDALVAGLDSPSLAMLAALTAREAVTEVPALLPTVLTELALAPLPADSDTSREFTASALAAQLIAGRITPRELAATVHRTFGHRLTLTERLAELDDEYDILEYGHRTVADVDADVITQAHELVARQAAMRHALEADAEPPA
ncbi:hypothetical protein ABH920_004822 [Catenulispora sp. EB89]|uniref:hypothetical protein n=1 Tax=Catenulispora sp. EB89 TaxID=3156257 RepID=UPI0035127403